MHACAYVCGYVYTRMCASMYVTMSVCVSDKLVLVLTSTVILKFWPNGTHDQYFLAHECDSPSLCSCVCIYVCLYSYVCM